MKLKTFILLGLTAMMVSACGASKNEMVSNSKMPFGNVYPAPCEIFDTKTTFAATGIFKGSANQKGECKINAIENAKAQIRAKFHHAYKGMISEYAMSEGNNAGNDISRKLERAGDQVLDIVLNDASESCAKFSEVDDRGMVECYVAIEIFKEDLSEGISKKVSSILTQEEKNRIRFNEELYREKMDKRFNQSNSEQ